MRSRTILSSAITAVCALFFITNGKCQTRENILFRNTSMVKNASVIENPSNNSQNKIQSSAPTNSFTDVTDIRVLPTTSSQANVDIAVNRQNPNSIVASSEIISASNTFSQGYYYSSNGGITWTGSETLPPGWNGLAPSVAFNNSNRVYAGSEGGSVNVLQSSVNGGATWGSQNFAGGNLNDPPLFFKCTSDNMPGSPYVNNYYGAWDQSLGGSSHITVNKSIDNGANFFGELLLKPGYGCGPDVKTGPNGEVYVCWADRELNNPKNSTGLGFCKSINGGGSYSAYQKVVTYTGIRDADAANPIFNNIYVYDSPSMGVDKSTGTHRGRIYVVVPVKENGNGKSVVRFFYSDNQGTSWSTPVTISIPAGRQNFSPHLAVDDCTGEVWVVYYSFDTASGFTTNTYIARSADGGDTWINQKVSDVGHITQPIVTTIMVPEYGSYYNGITAYGGKAYPIWSDNRSGNWQLYCSPSVAGSTASNITGAPVLCNHQTYTLTGFPVGTSVTWTSSTPSVILSGSGLSITATNTSYIGPLTLTATVNNGCSVLTFTITVQVVLAAPTAATQSGTWTQNNVTTAMAACNQMTALSLPCPDDITDPCFYKATGTVTDSRAASYAFSIVASQGGVTLTSSGNNFTVTCRRYPPHNFLTVRCTTTNGCGSAFKDYSFYVTTGYCNGDGAGSKSITVAGENSEVDQNTVSKLIISPNPSSGQFVLSLNTVDKMTSIKEVIITNKMGTKVFSQKYNLNQKTQSVQLSGQPVDTYMVQVFDGKEWSTQKLVLR